MASSLIFDLDGTLVDTVYAHVFAWQRALAEEGMPIDGWRIHHASASYGPLVRFAAGIGLRPQEWSALERRDVDWQSRTVGFGRRPASSCSFAIASVRARVRMLKRDHRVAAWTTAVERLVGAGRLQEPLREGFVIVGPDLPPVLLGIRL